jgi:outer membrane protein assembly factor BamA
VSLPPGIPAVGLQEGAPFLQFRLNSYIGAVLQQYQEKGFESARAEEPTVVPLSASPTAAEVQVDIRVKVAEGPQTVLEAVTFAGSHAFTPQRLNEAIRSRPGGPFYGPLVVSDADSIRVLYLNAGYQDADVRPVESFKDGRSRVDVRFEIREGQRIYVDRILVVGNDRTSTKTIEGEILLKPGEPLSSEALVESQRRLSGLGLFRRVQVTPQARGVGDRRDVLITVLEAPATTIGYGGGLEGGKRLRGAVGANGQAIESIDIAPHGSFEIGRRNLWGKNRSINLFTRASLRASDIQQNPDGTTSGGGYGFHEYRVLGSYREPRAFGSQSDVVFTAFVEQAVRSSFDFNRREARAEIIHRLSPRISISGQYSIERTRLFNERIAPADQLDIDRIFAPGVTLSAFSSSVVRDTRDDQLNPTSGSLMLFNGEVAARAIGSEVGLAKTFGQAFWFHRLPGPRGVVFATGGRLGLATGFPRPDRLGTGTVREVPASERFFAGGDTTVRGFALDRLGAPNTLDANGVPKGGNALLILNAEIRVPLGYRFDGVAFLDVGNVFATISDLSVLDLRSGAGFGVRYRSPIGPIRLDIGFKLDRHRFPDGTRESPYQWYIGIGQAF